MKLIFCDCGCLPCRAEVSPHLSCSWECEEVVPLQPTHTRVLGGPPGRQIIAIE